MKKFNCTGKLLNKKSPEKKTSFVIPRDWSRRSLLRSLGGSGAAVALAPFIPVMEAGAAETKPIRYMQFFTANQANKVTGFWQSNNGATNFPSDKPYAPLNKHKNDISVIANIHLQSGKDIGINPHIDASYACITGSTDLVVRGKSPATTKSIDQIIAHDLADRGIDTLYKSLTFGLHNPMNKPQAFSYWGGQKTTLDLNPRVVFDRLYKASGAGDLGITAKRGSVLDYVNSSLNRLNNRVSASDKRKLEFHFNSISEIEKRLAKIEDAVCGPLTDITRYDGQVIEEQSPAILDSFIDLTAAAFACDITRVVSLQFSQGHDFHSYPWLDLTGDFHAWTHGLIRQEFDESKRVKLPGSQQIVEKAMKWRSEKFVRLLDKLKAVDDGDGNALDNSGVMWWTETSRAHDYHNATWLVAGSMGGKLSVGQRKDYGNANHNKLLTSLAQGMGMNTNHIGDNKYGSGTLPGYLK